MSSIYADPAWEENCPTAALEAEKASMEARIRALEQPAQRGRRAG